MNTSKNERYVNVVCMFYLFGGLQTRIASDRRPLACVLKQYGIWQPQHTLAKMRTTILFSIKRYA